ncbi:hypothetical protein, partial [Streptococcus suis]|uniref:hypothetical protein n=1 Tax=Streptococcus suis TaxID=1307 RepID=UPI001E5C1F02
RPINRKRQTSSEMFVFILKLQWSFSACYDFEPVFLEEKNKKTTSYAGGCQGFELPFLFPVII